ncbi:MAG: BatD family protein [Magnetococcales bacterium]|nr:BatD family protein [Magnetococcales bacterium]
MITLKPWWWLVATGLWLFSWCAPVWAQNPEANLSIAEGPYYADAAVDLEVAVKGFEESPEPKITFDSPPWGRLELIGVSPEVSSSIQIINGHLSQWKSVRFNFHYRFIADRTGKVTLGPFRVTQGSLKAQTQSVTLELGNVPTGGGEQRILLQIPEEPVYVGQRVPVRLQWWIQEDMVQRLVAHEARVPLFDMVDSFSFEEVEQSGKKNALIIQTPGGAKKVPAETTKGQWEGRSWLVLTVDRIVIPLKAGEYAVPAASVILEEGTRWKTSFFGERAATQTRRVRVADTPRVFHVKPLPETGQPASFSGAIGQNFSLEVEAQRSVVQVGDPIRLTLTLKGEGALASASLPVLKGGEGGLPEQDFRIPEGDVPGILTDGAKKFEVMVRVLREGVREIPPIRYSWFDPQKGTYETTESRPIALSVGAAKMVSAGDVVRNQETEEKNPPAPAAKTPAPTPEKPPVAAKGPDIASESRVDADLAIERNTEVLLGGGGSVWMWNLLRGFGYLGGVMLLGYALWWQRQSREDPVKKQQRKKAQEVLAGLQSADTPRVLADHLRRLAASATNVPRQELDHVLESLDNQAFAPDKTSGSVDPGLKSRAVALGKRLAGDAS